MHAAQTSRDGRLSKETLRFSWLPKARVTGQATANVTAVMQGLQPRAPGRRDVAPRARGRSLTP